MINFEHIRFKNFFSFGNRWTEIRLDDAKTTIICGANGSGKSTSIVESITFALFGKAFRNINKKQVVNSVNKSDCVVELTFSVGNSRYKIVRGMNPVIFEIYKDGNVIDLEAKSRDYQKYLETNILKMDETSFRQLIVLGPAPYIPFMALTTQQRRGFIESLLDLNAVSTMSQSLKGRTAKVKERAKLSDTNLEHLKNKKMLTERHISEMTSLIKNNANSLKKDVEEQEVRLGQISKEIEMALSTLNELDVCTKNAKRIKDDRETLIRRLSGFEFRLSDAKEHLKSVESESACKTCGHPFSDEHREQAIEAARLAVEESKRIVETTKLEISALDTKYNELIPAITQSASLEKDISVLRSQESYLREELNKNLVRLRQSGDDVSARIEENSVALGKIVESIEKETVTNTKLKDLLKYYMIVSEMLGDGGIKSQILKNYIPRINKYINEYLTDFGLSCNFTLDENFCESIKSRHRDSFTYDSFSAGQKDRIDLALSLAWRKIARLRNKQSANILILDEVFNGSLDSKMTSILLDVLTRVEPDTNIFAVSHRQDGIVENFERTIVFELRGNFSALKDS